MLNQELLVWLEKTSRLREGGFYISPEDNIHAAESSLGEASLMVELPLSSPQFKERFENELADIQSSAIALNQDYEDRMNSNEHPEWHHYEIAESELKAEQDRLKNMILAQGWVCISKRPYSDRDSKLLIAHGKEDVLTRLSGSSPVFEQFQIEWLLMDDREVKKILGAYHSKKPLSEPAADGFFLNKEQEENWLNAIRSLGIQGYGWLTGAKQLLVCTLHEHMQIAIVNISDKNIRKQAQDLERIVFSLRDIQFHKKQASALGKNNPAFKALTKEEAGLEMEKSEKQTQVISALYQQGWIRLATMTSQNGSRYLYAEGQTDMGKKAKNLVRSIADSMGIGLVLNGKKLGEPQVDEPPQSNLFKL